VTPWESIEANLARATRIGDYWISRLEYATLQGGHFVGLWLENKEGEGMEVKPGALRDGVTPEWLDLFWKVNF